MESPLPQFQSNESIGKEFGPGLGANEVHCSDGSLSAFSFLGGVRWYIFLGKGGHEEEKRSSSYLEVTGMPFSQDI